MKPRLKIVPKCKAQATPARSNRRTWTNEQLENIFHNRHRWDGKGEALQPLNWQLRDELALAVFRLLTARMPWLSLAKTEQGYSNATWAASIADECMAELAKWEG